MGFGIGDFRCRGKGGQLGGWIRGAGDMDFIRSRLGLGHQLRSLVLRQICPDDMDPHGQRSG